MKEFLKAFICTKYFIVIVAVIVGLVSGYFWYPDNPIEEITEEVIKEETGIDIDLTPDSTEVGLR